MAQSSLLRKSIADLKKRIIRLNFRFHTALSRPGDDQPYRCCCVDPNWKPWRDPGKDRKRGCVYMSDNMPPTQPQLSVGRKKKEKRGSERFIGGRTVSQGKLAFIIQDHQSLRKYALQRYPL